jgi:hypothetical protein
MKSKDDKNLLEAYESVSKTKEGDLTRVPMKTLDKLHTAPNPIPATNDEDLAEWVKNRISRELPQDLDVREDLVKLYKKLSADQLGKEITKANTEETLTRAQYAMSGYNGPKS